jgi:hypothetical protein
MIRATFATLILCLAFPLAASAQEVPASPFRSRGGISFAFAPGSPNAYGIGAIAEPSLQIFDQLRVGLRIDGEALVGVDLANSQNVTASLRVLAAILAKVEYDFLSGDVRPFVGFGLGSDTVVILSGGTGGAGALAGTGFGVMPQLGVTFGGFRVAAQYHAVLTGPGAAANTLSLELTWRFL